MSEASASAAANTAADVDASRPNNATNPSIAEVPNGNAEGKGGSGDNAEIEFNSKYYAMLGDRLINEKWPDASQARNGDNISHMAAVFDQHYRDWLRVECSQIVAGQKPTMEKLIRIQQLLKLRQEIHPQPSKFIVPGIQQLLSRSQGGSQSQPKLPLMSWLRQKPKHKPGDSTLDEMEHLESMRSAMKRNHFVERVFLAIVTGCALIVPMVIMSLDRSLTKSLVTSSVAVLICALGIAIVTDDGSDVILATAAYSAVLVVFVGASLDIKSPSSI